MKRSFSPIRCVVTSIFFLVGFIALPLTAHLEHQNMDFHLKVQREQVKFIVHMNGTWLAEYAGLSKSDLDDLSGENKQKMTESLRALVKENCRLWINGRPGEVQFKEASFLSHVQKMPVLAVAVFTSSTFERPDTVRMKWDLFRSATVDSRGGDQIRKKDSGLFNLKEITGTINIDSESTKQYIALTPEITAYTWHRPGSRELPSIFTVTSAAPVSPIPVPVFSVLLVLFVPVVMYLARKRGPLKWTATIVTLFLAASLSGVGQVRVTPPWEGRVKAPSREKAYEIFKALHRNIYHAFDYQRKDAIYDTLSRSCRGEYLDKIYLEIIRGMRPDGEEGALTQVMKVDILDTEFEGLKNSNPHRFRVHCRWRVHGSVYHWNHTHARVNQYRATFTVSSDGTSWKFTDALVKSHRRVVRESD